MHCLIALALPEVHKRPQHTTTPASLLVVCLPRSAGTVPDNRWHQIPFAQQWKGIPLQHVLGVPLCQKWTGRQSRAPCNEEGACPWIVPERGGRGLMFPADCVLFFFSCTHNRYFACLDCFRRCLLFPCFMFHVFIGCLSCFLFLLLFLTSVLYRVDSFALITWYLIFSRDMIRFMITK